MKNFNKLFGGILLAFGVMVGLSVKSEASVVARMPKEVYVSTFPAAATVISITAPSTVTAAGIQSYQPGAVYQVILGTGAASEYFEMYDSTGVAGVTCGLMVNGPNQVPLGPKFLYGSTTANSVTTLDPPLMFHNGLVFCGSAATGNAAISYELGRGLSGQ